MSEADHFSSYNESKDFPVSVEPENNLEFPPHLQIFTFDQGNISRFPPPKSGLTDVLGKLSVRFKFYSFSATAK